VNLNKRCVTIDMQTPGGRDLFLRLLPHADFVSENFSPRVLGNLGIDYEAMRAMNPGVILCSLSAYGHDGPWANIPGIGGTIEPTSGMSALLGYRDGPPLNSGQMYPDAVAGFYGAAAILAALHHRERTGEGQYIDLSMQEANLTFAGDAALEYVLAGRQRPRMSNRHTTFAPHGIYPCAGEDRWLAIACETGEQWQAFRPEAGVDAWTSDPRFEDNAARKANEDALDAAIAAWTRSLDRDTLGERLARAGVIAAPVLDALEIAADPLPRKRGTIVEVNHPEAGRLPQVALPFHFSATPPGHVCPAPLLGEHSFEVFAELLAMDRDEYDALVDAGVSGMGPPNETSEEMR
jgi:crotonobetainyl-CoA:carnitine CoA-transferase CaiB-like acyl-CoA transferase